MIYSLIDVLKETTSVYSLVLLRRFKSEHGTKRSACSLPAVAAAFSAAAAARSANKISLAPQISQPYQSNLYIPVNQIEIEWMRR